MAIRTTKNSKGQILSQRSPVRSLLNSEFQCAIKWMARKKDKNGKPIGKITEADSIVKYEKDTFSLYAKSVSGKSVSINDVRGSAVFLRVIEGESRDSRLLSFLPWLREIYINRLDKSMGCNSKALQG